MRQENPQSEPPVQKDRVTEQNWGTSRYLNEKFQVFISLAGIPAPTGEPQLRYCLTLADLDFNEIMQKSFPELGQALEALNTTYGGWQLSQVETPKTGDGCSSCAAH